MAKQAKEFMTTWHTSERTYLPQWAMRDKSSLMNSGKSTRAVPMFRAFDLIGEPNQQVTVSAVMSTSTPSISSSRARR